MQEELFETGETLLESMLRDRWRAAADPFGFFLELFRALQRSSPFT